MLEKGAKAPDFTLSSDSQEDVSLSQFRGQKVVLYFYPKDNTPGCTTEACGFRDVYDQFLDAGAAVIGISPDSAKSHSNFREKHQLPFILLSDTDKKVINRYGAIGEKQKHGKSYMGVIRSTYIIDEAGFIRAVFPKVKPDGHAEEILKLLSE